MSDEIFIIYFMYSMYKVSGEFLIAYISRFNCVVVNLVNIINFHIDFLQSVFT